MFSFAGGAGALLPEGRLLSAFLKPSPSQLLPDRASRSASLFEPFFKMV
jgi:hypothetical protein